jgi:hypothetical protein
MVLSTLSLLPASPLAAPAPAPAPAAVGVDVDVDVGVAAVGVLVLVVTVALAGVGAALLLLLLRRFCGLSFGGDTWCWIPSLTMSSMLRFLLLPTGVLSGSPVNGSTGGGKEGPADAGAAGVETTAGDAVDADGADAAPRAGRPLPRGVARGSTGLPLPPTSSPPFPGGPAALTAEGGATWVPERVVMAALQTVASSTASRLNSRTTLGIERSQLSPTEEMVQKTTKVL